MPSSSASERSPSARRARTGRTPPIDVVNGVLALAAAESAARRMAIRADVPADLPVVLGDRVQLREGL